MTHRRLVRLVANDYVVAARTGQVIGDLTKQILVNALKHKTR